MTISPEQIIVDPTHAEVLTDREDRFSAVDHSLRVEHHPHSGKAQPTIISLVDGYAGDLSTQLHDITAGLSDAKPWAPFPTLQDFEFAEVAINNHLSQSTITTLLKGIHGGWADHANITMRNVADVEASVEKARRYDVRVSVLL